MIWGTKLFKTHQTKNLVDMWYLCDSSHLLHDLPSRLHKTLTCMTKHYIGMPATFKSSILKLLIAGYRATACSMILYTLFMPPSWKEHHDDDAM